MLRCDKCKKDINTATDKWVSFAIKNRCFFGKSSNELCMPCYNEFQRWLDGKSESEEELHARRGLWSAVDRYSKILNKDSLT